jgi:hypothetical protein
MLTDSSFRVRLSDQTALIDSLTTSLSTEKALRHRILKEGPPPVEKIVEKVVEKIVEVPQRGMKELERTCKEQAKVIREQLETSECSSPLLSFSLSFVSRFNRFTDPNPTSLSLSLFLPFLPPFSRSFSVAQRDRELLAESEHSRKLQASQQSQSVSNPSHSSHNLLPSSSNAPRTPSRSTSKGGLDATDALQKQLNERTIELYESLTGLQVLKVTMGKGPYGESVEYGCVYTADERSESLPSSFLPSRSCPN